MVRNYWPYSLHTKAQFGITRVPGRGFSPSHNGVDDAPTKDRNSKEIPLIASGDGTITNGKDGYGGLWVKLVSLNRIYFSLHLDRPAKASGSFVKAGDVIGYMGSTGHATGVHVHFEVRDLNNKRLDPDKQGLVYFNSENSYEMVNTKPWQVSVVRGTPIRKGVSFNSGIIKKTGAPVEYLTYRSVHKGDLYEGVNAVYLVEFVLNGRLVTGYVHEADVKSMGPINNPQKKIDEIDKIIHQQ